MLGRHEFIADGFAVCESVQTQLPMRRDDALGGAGASGSVLKSVRPFECESLARSINLHCGTVLNIRSVLDIA
jgi:hypothetical protein